VQRSIVAYCRAGFERECASDVRRIAERARIDVTSHADAGSALVVVSSDAIDDSRWQAALAAAPPWFARSIFVGSGPHEIGGRDRIAPLLAIARDHRPPFRAVWLETADTDAGKTYAGLCRRLGPLLSAAAEKAGLLASAAASGRRLHVAFVSASRVWMGASHDATGSPWPMGIPRLAMPRSAPSRSTLKLAEALLTFLSDDERARFLRPGMRAVDLGAAPGGWTWQLVQRGLRVKAIDNGPLKGAIADDPLVEHLRENGLKWRPRRPVDWMVCDMVESPSRIAALVAGWMADGACRRTIFNLKLPMKKRYAEVERCAALIADALSRRKLRHLLRFKQLYHDREEITGYCSTMY
jgi:23S rRNA (cytidine2498-2'-O)-methyltransferase